MSITTAMLPADGRDNSRLVDITPDRVFKRTEKGFRFSLIFKRRLWEASFKRCAYCGDEIKGHGASHVDHVLPRSEGGSESIDNLACACAFCNSSKGAGSLADLRFKVALYKSPVGGIVTPSQALALIEAGTILPIDYVRPFYFECVAREGGGYVR
ncbi:HNH endonuclease signature motif containing protein [Chromohalobacter sp. 48-RD10]|uniref:HNH endonuclease n=1 Tax=Chromohalobacter sp. 48-RD10 TaxID=2994063 RepID=UPI0024692231|nr:HNH endonuclease signature motif containing protein [Chromohalobacter sp. 48-RD10]